MFLQRLQSMTSRKPNEIERSIEAVFKPTLRFNFSETHSMQDGVYDSKLVCARRTCTAISGLDTTLYHRLDVFWVGSSVWPINTFFLFGLVWTSIRSVHSGPHRNSSLFSLAHTHILVTFMLVCWGRPRKKVQTVKLFGKVLFYERLL